MSQIIRDEDALQYHRESPNGKIKVVPTKPNNSQRDLSLAYSPGVAAPCKAIARECDRVFEYTARGNLVAVVSNGTAVLGLGNIGPEASKPVMEGKGVLFRKFAGIDVFDLELNCTDVAQFVATVKAMEPTFGGINLEDIKAPECFEIEKQLKKAINIPVMHDDQHGTAIITGAALLNAMELQGKQPGKLKMVVSGAGAAAMACTRLIINLGVKPENIYMLDRKGVLHTGREDLTEYKKEFATNHKVETLEEALDGADVFLGLSVAGLLAPEMLEKMAPNPIVFAMANPDPEIDYDLALKTRPDIVMATGRSDFPNQVNNVLGFPFIFRGALDVRATAINEDMKLAAVRALADLAREPVPEAVRMAYDMPQMRYGKDYIIPKPLDPRLITAVAPAVARAATESGVARTRIEDWNAYADGLRKRLGMEDRITRFMMDSARRDPRTVVFAEADQPSVLQAARIVRDEGIAEPILLGNEVRILQLLEAHHINMEGVRIIDPLREHQWRESYGEAFYEQRKRKGITRQEGEKNMRQRNYFGAMMVNLGKADVFISGLTRKYPDILRPALQTIGRQEGRKVAAGMYILDTPQGPLFFSDTTVNIAPEVEALVEIAELTHEAVCQFNITPRIAMLSYSNFGSNPSEEAVRVREATRILRERHPNWILDGEIQANFALNPNLTKAYFSFTPFAQTPANTLIFPNLSAGNMAYKLLQEVGPAEAIGPVLLGLRKPVHILQMGSSVREIANMVAISVVDAQHKIQNQ